MRVVIQRVSEASVSIEGKIRSSIKTGMLILVGIEHADGVDDAQLLAAKISKLRIFNDQEGKMNLSCNDVEGDLLVVSQFTLHADTRKGNRPSYVHAVKPEMAIPLYNKFVELLETATGKPVHTGEFGANMQVSLTNDGPVTINIDTKNP
jgi:D-aminoacyl-tRNA deacylase